jgi:hypothetical protein
MAPKAKPKTQSEIVVSIDDLLSELDPVPEPPKKPTQVIIDKEGNIDKSLQSPLIRY